MNLQNRKRLTDLENKLRAARGEGIVKDFGKTMSTLLHLKWITNKYSIWNSAQCYVPAWMGGEFRRECMYGWLSPFTVHLKLL